MGVAGMRQSVQAAAGAVVNGEVPALGGGGAIVLGPDGRFAMPSNTDGMFRRHIGVDADPRVAIWLDERT
jgi:isoaspartyl peptidase/L-asparaginase-like protein (Ntn-hydrolase superfamily)